MAEGARLESVYTLIRIEGSNPSLSANIYSYQTLYSTFPSGNIHTHMKQKSLFVPDREFFVALF